MRVFSGNHPLPIASDGFGGTFGTTDGAGHAEADSGSAVTWTQQTGVWSNAAGIASANMAGVATVPTTPDDVFLSVEVTRAAGQVGAVARWTDANNHLRIYHDGTNAKLAEVVAGAEAVLVTGAVAYSAGKALKLRITGTDGWLYYNDAYIGTTSSLPAGLTGTACGLQTTDATNSFDDFTVYAVDQSGIL